MHIIEVNNDNIKEFSNVLSEAAEWLESKGLGMWNPNKMMPENILKQYSISEMKLCYENDELIGAFVLQWEDPIFWPEIKENTSGFLHKLAVRRKYSSMGYGKRLIESAEMVCRSKGMDTLRLNCEANRPQLRKFYENLSFKMIDEVIINGKDQIRYKKRLTAREV